MIGIVRPPTMITRCRRSPQNSCKLKHQNLWSWCQVSFYFSAVAHAQPIFAATIPRHAIKKREEGLRLKQGNFAHSFRDPQTWNAAIFLGPPFSTTGEGGARQKKQLPKMECGLLTGQFKAVRSKMYNKF